MLIQIIPEGSQPGASLSPQREFNTEINRPAAVEGYGIARAFPPIREPHLVVGEVFRMREQGDAALFRRNAPIWQKAIAICRERAHTAPVAGVESGPRRLRAASPKPKEPDAKSLAAPRQD